jgi:uncharacterized protein YkwD
MYLRVISFAAVIFSALLAIPALAIFSTPVRAMDLNTYRASHGRPALSVSATLSGIASAQAASMARRRHLDHAGFKERVRSLGTTAAENVSFGCNDEDCAIRQWARSPRHRSNMLRGDVSAYGIASASADNGRRYWVLELGGE